MGTDPQSPRPSLREIVADALEFKDRGERDAYLSRVCGDDRELRARVDSLLDAQDRHGELVDGLLPDAAEDPAFDLVGTRQGRYRILDEIGEGGFAVVYRAEQLEPVRREVALKVLKAGVDTREVIARFKAERQALALMVHPNIAQVYDVGSTEGGRPYFAMELVPGEPITEYCDRHALDTNHRLELFIQVCQGVQHAHQKGVIHRDLKPTNVLVTRQDGQPVPKIIDFGVAKALSRPLTEMTLFTRHGELIGTPPYISPEQADAHGQDIDTRADVYGLGALLYELLTGGPPFDPKRLREAGFAEILRILRDEEPLKPSTRLTRLGDRLGEVARHRQVPPATLTRAVYGDLDWIVMKALEKDRDRRYETANGLARDIQRHLNHEAVHAAAPSTFYRARKWIRRHRMGAVLAVSVTMALVAGLAAALVGFAQARVERDRAVLAEAQAGRLARQESELRERAEASADATRMEKEVADANLRLAQVNQVQLHLDRGQVGPALALLEEQRATVNMQDSRSLEWRHLWWRAHQGHRFTLRGHEGGVNAVAFLPDGNLMVSAGDDGTVRLWDVAEGVEQASVVRHQAAIGCVAVSPDSKILAWGDSEGMLTLWDLRGRRVLRTIHTAPAVSLAFSPDARLIAAGTRDAGSRDCSVRVWSAVAAEGVGPELLRDYRGDVRPVVAFSPDGRTLACANLKYGCVAILDIDDLEVLTQLRGHRFWINALAFSPDGKTLVSGGNNTTVKIWDVPASRKKSEFTPTVCSPAPLALSPDGGTVAVGGLGGTIEVRDLTSGHTKHYGHVGEVLSLAFSPDGSTLASAGVDGAIKLWDLAQEQNPPPLHGHMTLVWTVTYSPDGETLALGGEPNHELWDLATQRLLRTIPTGGGVSVAFSPDGEVLAIGGNRFWDIGAGRELESIQEGGLAAAFSGDGKIIAIGGRSGQNGGFVRLWNRMSGQELATLEGHSRWVWSIAVSPDGRTLASASSQVPHFGEVILWEMGSGRRKRTLERGCTCVAFSPDGQLLASGSKSGGIALWDPDSGRLLKDMVGHVQFVEDLAFAPDGKTIVACNVQGGVTLWDVEKGIERATLTKRHHSVYSTAISPDGRTFATGAVDGSLQIWQTATEAEVQAQSDCFDPRLRLARRQEKDARMLQTGLRPKDALQAYAHAESLYEELALEFPDRTDYRPAMLASQNELASLMATCADPGIRDGQRALRLAEEAVRATGRTNPMYLTTLAAAHAEAGEFDQAVLVQQQAIALLNPEQNKQGYESRLRLYESGIPTRDHGQMALLASELLADGRFTEAEQTARECLAIHEAELPDDWLMFNARSMLGGALLGQEKYTEAESLLLSGYEGLIERQDQIPSSVRALRPREALQRLVQLYEDTRRSDQAVEWKQKLEALEESEAEDRAASSTP